MAGGWTRDGAVQVTTPAEWVNLDYRDYDVVSGSFDRPSGKLVIDFCGPNLLA